MIRKIIILMLLVLYLPGNLFAQESGIGTPKKKKSVILGISLGALGFAGVLIPGTFGWGNFYAKDRTGFLILNIGGSVCTLLEYYSINVSPNTENLPPLFTASLVGSLGFAVASTIWGALSVDSYNDRVMEKKQLSYRLIPGEDRIGIDITYHY